MDHDIENDAPKMLSTLSNILTQPIEMVRDLNPDKGVYADLLEIEEAHLSASKAVMKAARSSISIVPLKYGSPQLVTD